MAAARPAGAGEPREGRFALSVGGPPLRRLRCGSLAREKSPTSQRRKECTRAERRESEAASPSGNLLSASPSPPTDVVAAAAAPALRSLPDFSPAVCVRARVMPLQAQNSALPPSFGGAPLHPCRILPPPGATAPAPLPQPLRRKPAFSLSSFLGVRQSSRSAELVPVRVRVPPGSHSFSFFDSLFSLPLLRPNLARSLPLSLAPEAARLRERRRGV